MSGPGLAESLKRASLLAELKRQWGHCYIISRDGSEWVAERRDDGAQARRDTAAALLETIENDHAEQPVPLECRTEEAS